MRSEYSTRQRRDVMRFLEKNDRRHFTLDEILIQLQGEGAQIGRTTVYRTLEALAESGQVRKYQSAQGVTQYQHVGDPENCAHHFHLLCRECGTLYHVDCGWMQSLQEHIQASHGFQLDPVESMLVGVCAKCRGIEEAEHGADHHGACDHAL